MEPSGQTSIPRNEQTAAVLLVVLPLSGVLGAVVVDEGALS